MNNEQPFENIRPGLRQEYSMVVGPEHTARHLGSGGVYVLATPEMVRIMERASVMAVDHLLPAGYQTVGVRVDVVHKAPAPVGTKVTARAELIAVEGRRLTFRVLVQDDHEVIGEGTHERVIISLDRFAQRLAEKQASQGSGQ